MLNNQKISLFALFCFLVLFAENGISQTQVDSLKNLLPHAPEKEKINILVKIGFFLSSENPNEAIKFLDEAIELADETGNEWNKADALFNKGVALWHLGKINESDEYYNQAIPIYEAYFDSASLIKVYNSQAINHQMRGNVDKAFETFLHSLDFAKKIDDKATIFNTLLNIGIMYDNNSNYEKCLYYYNEALRYARYSDRSSLALLQSYIAEVYLTTKNYPKAEEFLNRAIENSKLSNDKNSLIWAYSSLGKIELGKKNFAKAESYYKESLALALKTDFKLDIIHAYTDLGKYYNATNNLQNAEKNLLEALTLSEELKTLPDLNIVYGELANLYSKRMDYKKAFEFHKKYKSISDTLYSISNSQQIAELDAKYELKQSEKQTELLKNENELQKKVINSQKIIALVIAILAILSIVLIWVLLRNRTKILKANTEMLLKNQEIEKNQKEISEKNRDLAGLNATKDKFFSIIAHDLRNPIAGFVNISELLEQEYERLTDEDKKDILKQMSSSSKNLIMLLENLLTWARLSSNKIEIYSEKLILSEIVDYSIHPYLQSAINKKIKVTVDVPSNIFINTDRFIFQAIAGNLINNAIKFSNQHTEINVGYENSENYNHLFIRDHGIGIEESQLRNIFVLGKASAGKGTMGESGTGLGLVLVKELVDKLGWSIEVKSKVNSGTEFKLVIPRSDGF